MEEIPCAICGLILGVDSNIQVACSTCGDCFSLVCSDCIIILPINMPESYNYLFKIKNGSICKYCMGIRERDFIISMSYDTMPLYINHNWLAKGSKEFFLKRLKRS